MSDSTFVQVMHELMVMKNPPGADTVYHGQQRMQTLERYKVTAADLERKSLRLAEDPTHAAQIWGQILSRLNPPVGK